MHPLMGVHGLPEGALAYGAQQAVRGQGAPLQDAAALRGGVHLPARRPDLLLRHSRRPQALLVQPARPAQPFACVPDVKCLCCLLTERRATNYDGAMSSLLEVYEKAGFMRKSSW